MPRPYRQIQVEQRGDVFCVWLRQAKMDENAVLEFGEEILRLIRDAGCRKLALSLGPVTPECLYSVFLTKLLHIRRALQQAGGALRLCDASPEVLGTFEACKLKDQFDFAPDPAAAVTALSL